MREKCNKKNLALGYTQVERFTKNHINMQSKHCSLERCDPLQHSVNLPALKVDILALKALENNPKLHNLTECLLSHATTTQEMI